MIMVGINNGSTIRARGSITGKEDDPYAGASGLTIGIIVLILLLLFGAAIVLYLKNKNE
jgi:hypothetical protein